MKVCSIEGCGRPTHAKNYCRAHYMRICYRGRDANDLRQINDGLARKHPSEHGIWNMVKQRCLNPKNKQYPFYGGRGITVCERWLGTHGFHHFLEDMGERPNDMTLDRIDNSKGYSPENCRWADWFTQAANRRPQQARELPVGVVRSHGRYRGRLMYKGKEYGKTVDTIEEAVAYREGLLRKLKSQEQNGIIES